MSKATGYRPPPDHGCIYSTSCLGCRVPRCHHDDSHAAADYLRSLGPEVVRLHDAGRSVGVLSEQFGIPEATIRLLCE